MREVEIDRRLFRGLLALLASAALVGLALLGRAHTPDPVRVIAWSDWWAIRVERQYEQELAQLREDLAELAGMLRANPDPVRAEVAASRLEQRHGHGLGLLERQRQAVVAAALAVRDWAAGYIPCADAVAAANEAVEIVGEERPEDEERMGAERPEPTPAAWWTVDR
jgi:hypothetical protein